MRRCRTAAVVAGVVSGVLLAAGCGAVSRHGPVAGGIGVRHVIQASVKETAPTLRSSSATGPIVLAAAARPASGAGFWLAATNGSAYPEGGAAFHGDASGLELAAPVVGIASTASGGGYWLLGGDGGVFSYGDAHFYGSTGNIHLNQPAIQMVAAPSGHGYWFVARDGGVFSFGDARFFGSTGGIRLNQPVVGMASTPDGGGYWLVARDGGVFTFGDARFYGAGPSIEHDAPALGLVRTESGHGYWMPLGNGAVLSFGEAYAVARAPIAVSGYSMVGQVVTIDPGHNGGNAGDPAYINQLVWNGRELETCDTTGTSTDAGYTEAAFNFDVAVRLAALLRSEGATVVMTRQSNSGVGPCVNVRAAIGNQARSDAVIDIHADGGPPGGRGFTVLEPVADGPNNAVIGASAGLAVDLRGAFESSTGEQVSTYDGVDGLQPRSDLAGLNLTTAPKVLIECANMRNATDASLVSSPAWRQLAAAGMDAGLSQYLIGYP